jgi:hypothetical protein
MSSHVASRSNFPSAALVAEKFSQTASRTVDSSACSVLMSVEVPNGYAHHTSNPPELPLLEIAKANRSNRANLTAVIDG